MELIEIVVELNPSKVMILLMGYLNVGEEPSKSVLKIMSYIAKKH